MFCFQLSTVQGALVVWITRLLAISLISVLAGSVAVGQTADVRSEGTRWVLGNAKVERVVETRPFLHTTGINNLTADNARRHAIESQGFVLALDGEKLRLTAADFQVQPPQAGEYPGGVQLVVPLRCQQHGVGVTVTYRLGHGDFYLRKQLEIEPGEHLVNWVDVERLRLDEKGLRRFDRQPMPFPMVPWDINVGRPLLAGREFFLGVEHPASINSFDDQRWISLRQYPGRKGKVTTAPAVIGVCPDRPRERLLDYLEQYVDQNRGRPVKRSIQWVAYFCVDNWYAKDLDDNACRAKIAVAEKVFRQRGVPLDVVLMDSGWTDPKSIMKISPKRPDRLALMSKLVEERLGAKLGLHVITSGVSPRADKDYLAAQGYDMISHKNRLEGAYCFADPRVLAEFQGNLLSYLRQYGIAAYKFDWGDFTCGAAGHRGHLPGKEYGFEAGASNFIRAQQAFRRANPDVFLFNTGWYSPWWLWTYDAVFTAGADYSFKLEGPPSFDTSSLLCTWRDATIRGNIVRWSPYFPINSLMTCDPISYCWPLWDVHNESRLRPFTDYLVTACLRGTQMIEIYNNIAAWSDAHADAAADILKWMKAHDDVLLASTRYLGGDPLAGQPYGYAHFTKQNRGILVVRNPALESRTLEIPFDESVGMWPGEKQYAVRIVYPYTKVLPETVRYGSKCSQRLLGHEAIVLEVWPLCALPEPMPVGRRYQVTARESGKTTFRLEAGPDTVEVLSPVKIIGGTPVDGKPGRYVVRAAGARVADHDNGSDTVGPPRMGGDCYVVPVRSAEGVRTRVAFQFAERGVKGETLLDGSPAAADTPHLLLPDAKDRKEGKKALASNWSLFGLDVGPGSHEVQFRPAKMPQHGVRVLIDTRRDLPATATLEIAHETAASVESKPEVLLPQDWAWEVRRTNEFQLPP
jgi:hypothetical protein